MKNAENIIVSEFAQEEFSLLPPPVAMLLDAYASVFPADNDLQFAQTNLRLFLEQIDQ